MNHIRDLLAASKNLMDRVNFDVVGEAGRGGNGGLVSRETIRASDELRRIINRIEREQSA